MSINRRDTFDILKMPDGPQKLQMLEEKLRASQERIQAAFDFSIYISHMFIFYYLN